jgi:hypothetical protein
VTVYIERCTEIERENRILYEKIFNINNQSPSFNSKSQAKSLNRDSRKRKIKEITEENLKLFERIKRKESAYQIQKFNIERKETEKVLSIISEFKQSPEAKKMSSTCFFKRGKKNVISEQLMHRQGKIINGRSYLVEVYRIGKSFKVVAFDLIDDEKFSVNLKKKKGIQGEVDELEFRKLVNRIDICGDGIKLLPDRPVSTLN